MIPKHINVTPDNKKYYPLHSHPSWEILYYIEGEGYLATENGNIEFHKGIITIIPPNILHGSVSKNGFKNISIVGDFNHILMFDKPVMLVDTDTKEGETLAKLIFDNRFEKDSYLASLTGSYIQFLLKHIHSETRLNKTLQAIITMFSNNYSNPDLNINEILNQSGYAEDYIRSEFKKLTGETPTQFLTKLRIENAKKYIEIYGKSITVSELAELSGFTDSVYFSKRFKALTGLSPNNYEKLNNNKKKTFVSNRNKER